MPEARTNETVHYEVLALRAGRWLIERTAPEESLAVKLADQLLHQDIEGVRVSRETVDGATGLSSSRKVYERLKPKRRRQRWTPRQKAAPPPPSTTLGRSPPPSVGSGCGRGGERCGRASGRGAGRASWSAGWRRSWRRWAARRSAAGRRSTSRA